MPTKIIYTPHYTTVGSPTISSNYLLSNTSSSNYVKYPTNTTSSFSTLDCLFKYTRTVDTSTIGFLFGDINANRTLYLRYGSLICYYDNSNGDVFGQTTLALNTVYWVRMIISSGSMSFYTLVDNNYTKETLPDISQWTLEATKTSFSNVWTNRSVCFGACPGSSTQGCNGQIDLTNTYLNIDSDDWEAVTFTEIETSGTVSVSKGYYDNGSNKIQMTSAITKYLTELSSGETTGCKNKLFAYSYNNTPGIKITANSNSDITTTHDVSVELDKNVYLSAQKNYIVGHTPLQTIPMQIGGELTTDYTANDPSAIDSDYILHSTAQGKYVYKNFSESDITTGEITLKCKQTAIRYRSDVIAGWALIGFAEGRLGMWDGGNWRVNTYYSVGTWVWVKVVYTPATSNFKIYGLVDNGYTLETLPDISQWTLEYNGQPSGTHFMTQTLYLPDAGGEWFQGDIDLKTVQVKKNGTEIWRAVTTPANGVKNSSNGFVYDSTNDTTFWYPTETILELSNFTDLQDRCNLYLANEDGKDVSRFFAGSSLPGPVKTNYVVEGSPTINSNYEASNFTNSNYISIPETIPSADGTTFITAISLTGSPPSDTGGVLSKTTGVPNVYIHDTMKLGCYDGDYSQAGPTTMAANTKYWLGIRYYSSSTQFFLLQDNGYTLDTLPPITNWNLEFWFSNKNEFGGSNIILGKLNAGLPFTVGTIYLEDTAILSGGTYVWKAVEPGVTIEGYKQQGYVYLNHAHNKVIGIWDEPDVVELETTATTTTNYTVVGSPTIDSDWIASNFSSSGLVSKETFLDNSYETFEIRAKITTGSTSGNQIFFADTHNNACSVALNVNNGRFCLFLSSNGSSFDIASAVNGSHTISSGTTYYVKLTFNGSSYVMSFSSDGVSFTDTVTINSTTKINTLTPTIGCWVKGGTTPDSSSYFQGSVDLKECYVKVDGAVVWRAVTEGALTEVSVSEDHYWTYLGNTSYDVQGQSMAASSMTGRIGSGYMMLNPNGTLAFTDATNAYQNVGGNAFSGYEILFTDNTHTEISYLSNQSATKCRVYARLSGSSYSALYTATVPPTGNIKISLNSGDGNLEIAPSGYIPSGSYTYDATNDTISIEGSVYSYIGDYYAII